MAFKKIDKEYCLTDNSVNCYGYRLLTEGFLMDRFKPAIGYLMHKREGGVAVKWEDLRLEGDKLFGKPVINTVNYPNLAGEIEAGFYDAASVGHIVALELSADDSMKLDGQTGPTVTKWFCRECSIVDIPGNYNALAKLYDDGGNVLADLSDSKQSLNIFDQKMDKPTMTVAMFAALNLMADATQAQVDVAFADLLAKAKKHDEMKTELENLKAEQTKDKVDALITSGKAEGKLTNELAAELEVSYKENPDGLKSLLSKMPKQTRVTGDKLNLSDVPEKWRGKTYRELYVSGELKALKAECPEYYEQLKTAK